MRALIFCWSESSAVPVSIKDDDIVICADSGYLYAERIGIKPDILIGDYDSLEKEKFEAADCEKICLPSEKNDTDTHFAVEYALKKGCSEIIICGGLGGARLDHMLANISTLKHIYECSKKGFITDGKTQVYYLPAHSRTLIPYNPECGYISVFPFSGMAEVTIKGLKYEINDYLLKNDYPIGVSNEFIENRDGIIYAEKGDAVVFLVNKL